MLVRLLDHDGEFLSLTRAGFAGLTDQEFFWEPVADCWSVQPRRELKMPVPDWQPAGQWGVDITYPDPQPSPFTTIAWRMTHLIGSVRVASATLVGRRRDDGAVGDGELAVPVPECAADAVEQWEQAIDQLRNLVAHADPEVLGRPERQWWDPPGQTAPVWYHVMYFGYFEPASHGAEVRLLRDLYRHTRAGTMIKPASTP